MKTIQHSIWLATIVLGATCLSAPILAQDTSATIIEVDGADDGQADYNLGIKYQFGLGVEKDGKEATRLYRVAAEKGHPEAQNDLAFMIYTTSRTSMSVPLSDEAAAEVVYWYDLAAKNGNSSAQATLSRMYGTGDLVDKDRLMGHMWLGVAIMNGRSGDATGLKGLERKLKKLEQKMSAAEIGEANRRAKACFSSNYTNCI